jgi:hypothetical protein
VAALATAAATVTLSGLLSGCAAVGQRTWTSFAAPIPVGVASPGISQAVRDLVAHRAEAIRSHDQAAFDATLAPTANAPARNQFDVLSSLPLRGYSLTVTGLVHADTDGRALATVTERYRLPGDGADAVRHGPAQFVRWRGGWAWLSWHPTRPDLWDLEPVRTATAGSVVAIASTHEMSATDLAQLTLQAATDVDNVWLPPWSGRVVVSLPATQRDFAKVCGVHSGAGNIGGLTTTLRSRAGAAADVVRVYLNPAAFSAGGSVTDRIILTHEVTHVAQSALPDGAPLWLVEGSADFVGYSVTDLSPSVVAQDLIGTSTPSAPPDDAAFRFDSSSTDLARAYEQSWSLLRSVADRDGTGAVSRLYAAVVRAHGTELQRESRAMRRVLGEPRGTVLAQWQTWLADHL